MGVTEAADFEDFLSVLKNIIRSSELMCFWEHLLSKLHALTQSKRPISKPVLIDFVKYSIKESTWKRFNLDKYHVLNWNFTNAQVASQRFVMSQDSISVAFQMASASEPRFTM